MREGHLREGELAVGTLIHRIGEAIRATDNEDKALDTRRHTLLDKVSKLNRAELQAVLIEEHKVVGVVYKAQDGLALKAFLLRLREVLCVAQVGKRGYRKAHVVVQALGVHRHKSLDLLHIGLTNNN